MYNKGEELLNLCNEQNKKIYEIVIEEECSLTEHSIEEVRNKMNENLQVMIDSANSALNKKITSISGITGGDAKKVEDYKNSKTTVSGKFINEAMAKALSTSEV
ncbi:MAG TPA: L-serine ammonia-lyase, iron-sulfur-dependent, subunit alpha, partial [Tissierellales bacterium]|nr:L-serine ammonia-lyase, iron-sulfur-dependent, subunit alpha [Tissierellales bacterium]